MDLHHALFWACLTVTGIAELLILRSAFFPSSAETPTKNVPHSPRAIEMLWGVIPAFALAAIFLAAWRAL